LLIQKKIIILKKELRSRKCRVDEDVFRRAVKLLLG